MSILLVNSYAFWKKRCWLIDPSLLLMVFSAVIVAALSAGNISWTEPLINKEVSGYILFLIIEITTVVYAYTTFGKDTN